MDKWIDGSERAPNEPERLAKWLAHAGVASRRHAEALITAGAVRVNGQVITEQGIKIDPAQDLIEVNGRRITSGSDTLTVAVHKPVGYVSTAHDPHGRPIIADLLPPDLRFRRLVPVGRLDADSSGLILLSNDGDLALRLTHPRYGATKVYHAAVEGLLSPQDLADLRCGVVLAGEDERPTAPAEVRPLGEPSWYRVALREGRKRQVRLMFAAVGAVVVELVRVQIGTLELDAVVPNPGDVHILTPADIARALAGTREPAPRPRPAANPPPR